MFLLRKLLLFVSVAVLITSLLFAALFWTFEKTAADRVQVKRWLEVSNFYDNLVDETITVLEENFEDKKNEYPIQAEVVSAIAKSILTSELIKSQIEPAIDVTYDWLSSDKQVLDFVIDLTDAKNDFIDRTVDETASRLSILPQCTQQESRILYANGKFSTLNLVCIPEGLDIEEIKETVKQETNFSEFLPDSVVKAEEIKINENGEEKSLQDALNDAPQAYQNIRKIAWFTTLIALVLSFAVFFLSEPRRQGVKNLVKAYITGAVFVGFFAVLIQILSSGSLESFVDTDSETLTSFLEPLIREIMRSTSNWLFIFVVVYLSVAMLGLGYAVKTKPKDIETKI